LSSTRVAGDQQELGGDVQIGMLETSELGQEAVDDDRSLIS